MTTTNLDLKNVLSALDDINSKNYASHIYIPSLQRDVPFLQINTAQQKTLIKSIIDSPVYNTEFIFAIRSIIQDNCLDKTIKIDSLTLLDKLAICLALRSKSISSKYDSVLNQNGTELKYSVELDPLIDAIKQLDPVQDEVISLQDYEITVGAPTIGREYFIERDIRSKNNQQSTDIQTNEQLRMAVGEAFITELVKYIKALQIPHGQEAINIDVSALPPKNAIEILNKLPVKVLEKILAFANAYSSVLTNALKVRVPVGTDPETNEVKYMDQEVQVNGNFFIIS